MKKEDKFNGKNGKGRVRKLPKTPVKSEFTKAPKDLPLDFYKPLWFNKLLPGQKRVTANCSQVAFLPDASQSLKAKSHPDEKLGDNTFSGKYLEVLKQPYVISEDEEEAFEDGDDQSDSDTSIDLECPSEGSENEAEEPKCFEDGDYGALYDKEEEDKDDDEDDHVQDEVGGKNKGKQKEQEDDGDDEDEDDGDWMEDE